MARLFKPIPALELGTKIFEWVAQRDAVVRKALAAAQCNPDIMHSSSRCLEVAISAGLPSTLEDNEVLLKDLSKVLFNYGANFSCDSVKGHVGLSFDGLHTTAEGLSFLGCAAGNDRVQPVAFIIYWDGTELRGYIPTQGNLWNTDNGLAYSYEAGYNSETNAMKRFGVPIGELEFNVQALLEDIKARIQPQ